MPNDESNAASNGLAAVQEVRLQRVEGDLTLLKIHHAETNAAITYLGSQLADSTKRIFEKIDTCVFPLSEKIQQHIVEDSGTDKRLITISNTLDRLDTEKKASALRWQSWKTGLVAILTGAGAIGLKELIVFISSHHG